LSTPHLPVGQIFIYTTAPRGLFLEASLNDFRPSDDLIYAAANDEAGVVGPGCPHPAAEPQKGGRVSNHAKVSAARLPLVGLCGLAYLVLMALDGLSLFLDQKHGEYANYIIFGLIEWLTIGALVWRWRQSGSTTRFRWGLIIAAVFCAHLTNDINFVEAVRGSYPLAHGIGLSIEATGGALFVLACTATFRSRTQRITSVIDGVMTVTLVALFFEQVFSLVTPAGSSDPAAVHKLIDMVDALNVFTLLCACLRLIGAQKDSNKHFFFVTAMSVIVRGVAAATRNRLILIHPVLYMELLRTPGSIALGLLCLASLPKMLSSYQPNPKVAYVTESLSPFLLGLGLLGISYSLSTSHPWLYLVGVSVAIVGYAFRNVVTQTAQLSMEQSLRNLQEQLQGMVITDPLTGVSNRRGFDEALEHGWATARREGHPLSVLMIDVDHFKKYNDNFGHSMGDECLRTVARLLAGALRRPTDFFARFGGEEFAAILPNTPLEGAYIVAKRMNRVICEADIRHVTDFPSKVTVSIGAAQLDGDATMQDLLHRADTQLYQAKARGRNRYA